MNGRGIGGHGSLCAEGFCIVKVCLSPSRGTCWAAAGGAKHFSHVVVPTYTPTAKVRMPTDPHPLQLTPETVFLICIVLVPVNSTGYHAFHTFVWDTGSKRLP